jgi:spoIIIJ-associated protein
MKDAVFTGDDVAAAVAAAARALGRAPEALRYVVLEPGGPGGRGLKPTVARIAVLLDDGESAASPRAAEPVGRAQPSEVRERPEGQGEGWATSIRQLLEALVRAGDLDLRFEIVEEEEKLRVRLPGPDRAFFLEDGGEGLSALDHLLRKLAPTGDRRRLVMECEGYRDARDEALREEALRLADGVIKDGRSRRTEPLNAYERRIIHMTLAEVRGVRSYSVGEEGDRRVVVALVLPQDDEEEDETPGEGSPPSA